jgi:transketolase
VLLINISSPLCISDETILKAVETGKIIVFEDHNVKTGLGSIISNRITDLQRLCKVFKIGVDSYACSGVSDDVYAMFGLNFERIKSKITEVLDD